MPHNVAPALPRAATRKFKAFLLTAVSAALLAPVMAPSSAFAAVALDPEEAAFCGLINNYRASKGLPALMVSEALTNASEWHSTDMATKNYFSHTDSLGRDPFKRMTAFGYGYSTYRGENIAAGNATAQATFDQWKNSSGHNANMLNANYKVIGIGKATTTTSTYKNYWTTDFGGVVDSGAVSCPGSTPPPATVLPSLTISDLSMVEGSSSIIGATKAMQFKVTLSAPTSKTVTVSYITSNGTATAPSDFKAVNGGTVSIPAGSTSGYARVNVIKDRVREANENFYVDLYAPVNAAVADGWAIGTIVNDD
jgi:uncharacterized protein YkwD